MDKKYYDIGEITRLFDSYRCEPMPEMAEGEYELFCAAIKILPKDVVDRVHKEVQFVYLRDEIPENVVKPACYINLEQESLGNKRGIILLTPYVVGAPEPPSYVGKDGVKRKLNAMMDQVIVHEVAHYYLGHSGYKNETDKEPKEKAADEQVALWIKEYWEHNSCLPDKDGDS
jgi:hypothetical protein